MSAHRIRPSTLLLLGSCLAACADLPPFERGICGNGVLEPELGEDCDSFAGEGLACGAPEDADRACRFTCGAEQVTCPTGWACGGDGRCRYASGVFESHVISGRFLGEVEHLSSGDFNGDGRTDLFALTQGAISVRYGADGQGGPEFDLPFPSVGAPAVADLDGDGRSDVVVPQYEGLVILRGETDQTLHPVPSPFAQEDAGGLNIKVVPVLERRGEGVDTFLAVAASELGICAALTTNFEACESPSYAALSVNFSAPRPGAQLGVVKERILEPDFTVREFVYAAVAGEPKVFVVEVAGCPGEGVECVDGVRRVVPQPTIELSAGGLPPALANVLETTGQLLLADHDGDGRNDVLIGVRFNGQLPDILLGGLPQPRDGVLVSHRTDSGFAPPTLDLAFTRLAFRSSGPDIGFTGSAFPLAAANLDLDPRADYVGAEGVFGWDGDALAWIAGPSLDRWSEAVIADLNRDGLLDVSASLESVEGIEFLQGTGLPLLNPTLIGTRGKARVLRAGDFDGDLVLDLAFVDQIPRAAGMETNGGVETRIKISFGALQGPPGAPVDIGPLEGVTDLVPAYFTNGDLIADLLVHAFEPGTTLVSMAMLTGTTRRRMFSTLVPPDAVEGPRSDEEARTFNPTLGVRVGAFNPASAGFDILAVRKMDQWLLSGAGDASFPSDQMSRINLETSCPSLVPRLDPTCAVVATGRLRSSDEVDSVVAFENMASCGGAEQTARITVMQLDPTMGPGVVRCWSTQVQVLEGGIPSQASLVDLNGVGSPELVVVYGAGEVARGRGLNGENMVEAPTQKSESGLAVYWNLGGVTEGPPIGVAVGGISEPTQPAATESPAAFGSADVVGAASYQESGNVDMGDQPLPGRPNQAAGLVPGFLATSPIVGDVDVERELLVLTTDGLFVMDFSGNPEVPLLRPIRWENFGRGDRIHTTDLDGDGLLDVVIARGAEFEVLKSVPHDRVVGMAQ